MFGLKHLSIKSKLQIILLITSLGSIFVVSYLSWSKARELLTHRIFNQLTSVRASKGYQVEAYFKNLQNHLQTLCENHMTVAAMQEFNQSFDELERSSVSAERDAKIESYYTQKFFPRLAKNIEGEPVFETYRPTGNAARQLQYQYIANNPNPVGKKDVLDDAKDNSKYSAVHRRYHPLFRNLIKRFGYYDMFLVDAETGDIVYTVYKETDFGTNLYTGSYRNTNLAEVVRKARDNPDRGVIQLVDFQFYRPSYNAPAAFMAGSIYDGSRRVGILVVQLPIDEINRVLTGNQNWKQDGLGDTGETYLVGEDLRLRSAVRLQLENSAAYLNVLRRNQVRSEIVRSIEQLKTSLLVLPINSDAAKQSVARKSGTEIMQGYGGFDVLSSYAPLNIAGVNWGIISEIALSEAYAPINALQNYLLLSTLILILLITLLATIATQRLMRPIDLIIQRYGSRNAEGKPLIQQLQAGNYHTPVDINRNDEFGELGRVFNAMVSSLGEKLAEIEQKNQENDALMLNIVPLTIAQRLKQGESLIADHVKQVTILYARVVGIAELSQRLPASEVTQLLTRLFHEFDQAAERFGLERKSTIDTDYMVVCGLTIPRLDHGKRTVDFGVEMLNILHRMELGQDLALGLRIGIHSGSVTAGVIGNQKFGYKVWGESVYLVMRLYTQAELNSIVMTRATYEWVADSYTLVQYRPIQIDNIGEVDTWILVSANRMSMSKVDLVQSSFAKVQPIADTAAELFYQRLFELSPSLRPLFKGSMEDQQRKLMSTLAIAVEGLRQPAAIIKAVQELGKRHAGYGVKAEYYEVVGEALLWTLEQGLGEAFTPQVRRAWEEAYKFLSEIMKDAAAQVEHQNIGV